MLFILKTRVILFIVFVFLSIVSCLLWFNGSYEDDRTYEGEEVEIEEDLLKEYFTFEKEEKGTYEQVIRQLDEIEKRKAEQERKERERKEREERQKAEDGHDEKQSQQHAQVIDAVFTFYTSDCKGCTGLTRWGGHDVRNTIYVDGLRVIATDPNVIPPYSLVEFELNGDTVKAIALDTGGAIKGNKIDLLVSSSSEAFNLGKQTIPVTVLRSGK